MSSIVDSCNRSPKRIKRKFVDVPKIRSHYGKSTSSIDEDDYLVLRELMLAAGVPDDQIKKEVHQFIGGIDIEGRIRKLNLTRLNDASVCTLLAQLQGLSHLHKCGTRMDLLLAKLPALSHLHLSGTTMDLTDGLGSLTNLTSLSLVCSNIKFGDLSNVEELDLHKSNIKSLPPISVGCLQNLKNLRLSETKYLFTLPEDIGNISSLEKLDLRESSIQSLPTSIGCLQNLKILWLSRTKNLLALPEEIGNITSLETLGLDHSNIQSLPLSIGFLQNLRHLGLALTKHLLALPEEIGNLTSLATLSLDHSNMESLPTSIGSLKKLRNFHLSHTMNLLALPEEIGNLTSLEALILFGSNIQSLPLSIGCLQNLKELSLFCSKIQSLPPSIGCLQNLKTLHLAQTKNLLALPEEIGNLTGLTCLSLTGSRVKVLPRTARDKLGYAMACRKAKVSLQSFGIDHGEHPQECVTILAENAIRIPPKLFPRALRSATVPFKSRGGYTRVMIEYHCSGYEIPQHEAIYKLLEYGRESFVSFVVGMRQPSSHNRTGPSLCLYKSKKILAKESRNK